MCKEKLLFSNLCLKSKLEELRGDQVVPILSQNFTFFEVWIQSGKGKVWHSGSMQSVQYKTNHLSGSLNGETSLIYCLFTFYIPFSPAQGWAVGAFQLFITVSFNSIFITELTTQSANKILLMVYELVNSTAVYGLLQN